MGEFAIGQPVPRFEDPRLIKGGGRYIADMVFPGMAFGYVLRSPHAHARIRAIDTAKAKAAPGVLAIPAHCACAAWGRRRLSRTNANIKHIAIARHLKPGCERDDLEQRNLAKPGPVLSRWGNGKTKRRNVPVLNLLKTIAERL